MVEMSASAFCKSRIISPETLHRKVYTIAKLTQGGSGAQCQRPRAMRPRHILDRASLVSHKLSSMMLWRQKDGASSMRYSWMTEIGEIGIHGAFLSSMGRNLCGACMSLDHSVTVGTAFYPSPRYAARTLSSLAKACAESAPTIWPLSSR